MIIHNTSYLFNLHENYAKNCSEYVFLLSFCLLWFETVVYISDPVSIKAFIIAQNRIWNLGSLPIEKLFSCQSLVNFGLTYITLEVTVIRNTSFACPRRGLYVAQLDTLMKILWEFQLNPSSSLGGVVDTGFGDLIIDLVT